jgi:sodium transport system permease protein
MQWRNIRLIFLREIRDQLRDRRTLFMIAVLPLILYPLLGMSVFQLSQFLRKSEPNILVIGSEQLDASGTLPPLFQDGRFAAELFSNPAAAAQFNVEFRKSGALEMPSEVIEHAAEPDEPAPQGAGSAAPQTSAVNSVERWLKAGDVDVVLYFPPDFGEQLLELRDQVERRASGPAPADDSRASEASPLADAIEIPEPELFFNSGKDKSRVAHMQIERVVNAWKTQIVRANLAASHVPASVARPFELKPHDVAERHQQQALVWSKILPFVLFIWALTGAFYPAVDLCAGEKERGTLETLLSSPARRTEIVWGKLLTVMTFSCATALLNLASLGFTARYVIAQLRLIPTADMANGLELPPLAAVLWLVAALVPMSALFSALCLACAAFARSTKEGQYYLMPLLLVTMPLMMLPMAPGAELDLGNSLLPVTGVVLLLRSLIQGNYAEAIRYLLPVGIVTLACCHLAIRWAVYQFNQESVLFRESERLDLRRWIVHLVRDRRETPSLAEAFFAVVLIYVIQFFTGLAISANPPAEPNFGYLALILFISQIVCVALPVLLMTLLLTGRPLKTLLLDRIPSVTACLVAMLLAVLLHPVGLQLSHWIRELYPLQEDVTSYARTLGQLLETAPWPWLPYVLLGLLPALCEELAFRGFVLSGLRHLGSKWWAIALSAIFFGLAHNVIQQSISAVALGLVIGYIAVQSGSLVPCILFHTTYNALMFATLQLPALVERRPELANLFHQPAPDQLIYNSPIVAICGLAAVLPLMWLHRLPYQATREEQLTSARAQQPHSLMTSASGAAE